MRKLLVFQHSAREPLGLLDPMLRRHGFRIRYVNFSRQPDLDPDVSRYNGLIVLGGQMNVDQADRYPHLNAEIAAIRHALELDIPVLGICLGAQLLAAALGANVRPHSVREIGWYRLHPTAAAHSTLAWLLECARFVRRVAVREGVTAYLFAGDGYSVAVISPAARHAAYALPAGAMDLFGNPLPENAALGSTVVYLPANAPAEELERLLQDSGQK